VGIATRFVKDKGVCGSGGGGGGGGGRPDPLMRLLDLEEAFLTKLEPVILFSGFSQGLPPALLARMEGLLRATYITRSSPEEFIDQNFSYLYSNEAFIGGKSSFLRDVKMTTTSRSTIQIRVALRSCASKRNVAFIAFHYTWEYITTNKIHFREDGECVQTWVTNAGHWQLFGEYMDANRVEPVARDKLTP
jgi:hypothetical protein